MFDPKDIYGDLNVMNCIGGKCAYELQLKDWPCTEMAYIRVFLRDEPTRQTYVLIAPGCTVEGTAEELRAASRWLTGDAVPASCKGGDYCGF